MSCKHSNSQAVYACNVCGKPLCPQHAKLRTLCPACLKKTTLNYTIVKAKTKREKEKIREFVERFWGEQEQLTFDKRFIVAELPTYIAREKDSIVGFISFAETEDATIIAALGILPQCQNAGVGKALIKKVEAETKRLNKKTVARFNIKRRFASISILPKLRLPNLRSKTRHHSKETRKNH